MSLSFGFQVREDNNWMGHLGLTHRVLVVPPPRSSRRIHDKMLPDVGPIFLVSTSSVGDGHQFYMGMLSVNLTELVEYVFADVSKTTSDACQRTNHYSLVGSLSVFVTAPCHREEDFSQLCLHICQSQPTPPPNTVLGCIHCGSICYLIAILQTVSIAYCSSLTLLAKDDMLPDATLHKHKIIARISSNSHM
ncbi:hypothetical protein P153DRAFT_55039 [Dothidotthia symphoricarpi CBS 119687]|uniref:Uncharacterized protein n=1 Tax=Dothidotthia symphoricarpi CBS 119687 TaxID=1392245 RepID=A0A6A6A993_9PLEO|nr:uncharacterized protein P153DRAFT_55039 [Dothidotthia symphoricarpi CBS 119687]KAF2127763.1 hypothetical protein P153DRAFT_55039 [Dothidotthia symphoricarpi CBS 119687]